MTFLKTLKITNALLIALMAGSLATAGCAGRNAVPILPVQATDKRLSCKNIEAEQFRIQSAIQALQTEKQSVTSYNTTIGILGFLLFPIWLALDLSTGQAADAEIAAFQQRLGRLQQLTISRDCPLA